MSGGCGRMMPPPVAMHKPVPNSSSPAASHACSSMQPKSDSNAMELRRCVVEAANAGTALMLASARAAAANSQLLSVAIPMHPPPSRCSSRASSASRQSVKAVHKQQQVSYEQWLSVVVYWLEQLEMLVDESVGSMLMRFMWISRSNIKVAATFSLLNDAYRGRRLHSFLEAVVKEVNLQPGMIEKGVQIDCNLQKVHLDAHRRQTGARVSSQSMPVLVVLPSASDDSLQASDAKSLDQQALCYAWQELARVANALRSEFENSSMSRRRRQAMFGKPWTYRSDTPAPDTPVDDARSVASWPDDSSCMSSALTYEQIHMRDQSDC